MNEIIKRYSVKLFLFFCFFPYIKILPINTDLQPLAFIFGVIYLGSLYKVNIDKKLNYILFTLFVSCIILFKEKINFASFRSLFGYLNVYIIALASYNYFKTKDDYISYRFLRNILLIYLFCSLIQKYINSMALHFLLNRDWSFNEVQGRGVESLTAEPTFYGFILLLIIPFVIVGSYTRVQQNKLFFLIVFQLLFFSKSTSAIGTLMLCFIPFFILNWRISLIILLSFSFLFLFLFYYDPLIITDTRAYKILTKLYSDGFLALTQSDPSSRGRLYHLFFSIKGGFEHYLLPNGFNSFNDYMIVQKKIYSELRWSYVKFEHGRILSYLGSMIYELGIFCLPIIYFYFNSILKLNILNIKKAFMFILFFGVLLQAITLSHPTVPLFFGMILVQINKNEVNI